MLAAALAMVQLSLGQVPADEPLPPVEAASAPAVELSGGAEVGPWFLAGGWMVGLRPSLSLELSADFGVALEAPLRSTGTAPLQLRGEDWDERSDLGQLLRALSVGAASRPVQIRAGELRAVRMGHGHLLAGYFNRLSEDYRPAGAHLLVSAGQVAVEAVASDVLAARLFAGAVRATTGDEGFHAELSALHDFGQAGGTAPPLTLAHLDLDVGLFRGPSFWLNAFIGGGVRVGVADPAGGGVLGLSVDGRAGGLNVGGRVEVRRVEGGYRPGMVGVGYELSRMAGTGFSGVPLADERLPPAFSGLAEIQVECAARSGRVVGLASVEAFTFGRMDARAWFSAQLFSGWLTASGVMEAVELNASPRLLVAGDARVRFAPSLYAWASAGTSFRPAPAGGLERALVAGLGLAADFDLAPGPR